MMTESATETLTTYETTRRHVAEYSSFHRHRKSDYSKCKKKKVKLSLEQAVEAHRIVRRRGSHIF
jgi:hypothetical protein